MKLGTAQIQPDRGKKTHITAFLKKAIILLVSVCIVFLIARNTVENLSVVVPEILISIGLIADEVKIAGTGSMYPTFPKGTEDSEVARAREIVAWSKMKRFPSGFELFGRRFFGYTVKRGDIVSFSNTLTSQLTKRQYDEELGFIKRVIAITGDRVEIRNGFVFLNGEQLKEPYTARPRSTFGGSFMPDCKQIIIGKDQLFILGDNRTGSSDSRHDIGLIRTTDVDHIMPFTEQNDYKKNWRDSSHDDSLISQPTLDAQQYVMLLNKKRKEVNLPELKLNNKLIASARKRGEVILANDDLSFEATRSGYGMKKALRDVGYINITWGEAPALGYYTAPELIENSFQFSESREFLLDPNFDDVGVAAVLGNINGCPSQVVVQHYGGYIPPNYSKSVIENWKKAIINLQNVRPSWIKLRTYDDFYRENKKEVDRMIELIDYRMENMVKIIARMEKNEWLNEEERAYLEKDASLFEEQNKLATILNSK